MSDVKARLASRTARDVAAFNAAMDLRAARYGKAGGEPVQRVVRVSARAVGKVGRGLTGLGKR